MKISTFDVYEALAFLVRHPGEVSDFYKMWNDELVGSKELLKTALPLIRDHTQYMRLLMNLAHADEQKSFPKGISHYLEHHIPEFHYHYAADMLKLLEACQYVGKGFDPLIKTLLQMARDVASLIPEVEKNDAQITDLLNTLEEFTKQEHWSLGVDNKSRLDLFKVSRKQNLCKSTHLHASDLSNLHLQELRFNRSYFEHAVIENSAIIACDFQGAMFENVSFAQSVVDPFTAATLIPAIRLSNRKERRNGIPLTGLNGVKFIGDFSNMDFRKIALKDADFSGAILTGVNVEGCDLTGSILTLKQAKELLYSAKAHMDTSLSEKAHKEQSEEMLREWVDQAMRHHKSLKAKVKQELYAAIWSYHVKEQATVIESEIRDFYHNKPAYMQQWLTNWVNKTHIERDNQAEEISMAESMKDFVNEVVKEILVEEMSHQLMHQFNVSEDNIWLHNHLCKVLDRIKAKHPKVAYHEFLGKAALIAGRIDVSWKGKIQGGSGLSYCYIAHNIYPHFTATDPKKNLENKALAACEDAMIAVMLYMHHLLCPTMRSNIIEQLNDGICDTLFGKNAGVLSQDVRMALTRHLEKVFNLLQNNSALFDIALFSGHEAEIIGDLSAKKKENLPATGGLAQLYSEILGRKVGKATKAKFTESFTQKVVDEMQYMLWKLRIPKSLEIVTQEIAQNTAMEFQSQLDSRSRDELTQYLTHQLEKFLATHLYIDDAQLEEQKAKIVGEMTIDAKGDVIKISGLCAIIATVIHHSVSELIGGKSKLPDLYQEEKLATEITDLLSAYHWEHADMLPAYIVDVPMVSKGYQPLNMYQEFWVKAFVEQLLPLYYNNTPILIDRSLLALYGYIRQAIMQLLFQQADASLETLRDVNSRHAVVALLRENETATHLNCNSAFSDQLVDRFIHILNEDKNAEQEAEEDVETTPIFQSHNPVPRPSMRSFTLPFQRKSMSQTSLSTRNYNVPANAFVTIHQAANWMMQYMLNLLPGNLSLSLQAKEDRLILLSQIEHYMHQVEPKHRLREMALKLMGNITWHTTQDMLLHFEVSEQAVKYALYSSQDLLAESSALFNTLGEYMRADDRIRALDVMRKLLLCQRQATVNRLNEVEATIAAMEQIVFAVMHLPPTYLYSKDTGVIVDHLQHSLFLFDKLRGNTDKAVDQQAIIATIAHCIKEAKAYLEPMEHPFKYKLSHPFHQTQEKQLLTPYYTNKGWLRTAKAYHLLETLPENQLPQLKEELIQLFQRFSYQLDQFQQTPQYMIGLKQIHYFNELLEMDSVALTEQCEAMIAALGQLQQLIEQAELVQSEDSPPRLQSKRPIAMLFYGHKAKKQS